MRFTPNPDATESPRTQAVDYEAMVCEFDTRMLERAVADLALDRPTERPPGCLGPRHSGEVTPDVREQDVRHESFRCMKIPAHDRVSWDRKRVRSRHIAGFREGRHHAPRVRILTLFAALAIAARDRRGHIEAGLAHFDGEPVASEAARGRSSRSSGYAAWVQSARRAPASGRSSSTRRTPLRLGRCAVLDADRQSGSRVRRRAAHPA